MERRLDNIEQNLGDKIEKNEAKLDELKKMIEAQSRKPK